MDNENNEFAKTYDAFEIFTRCILLHPNLLSIVLRQSGNQTAAASHLTPPKAQSNSNDKSNDNTTNTNDKLPQLDNTVEKEGKDGKGTSSESISCLTPILSPMSFGSNNGKNDDIARDEQKELNKKSLSELYHILLSCFTMKFSQICIQYVMYSMAFTQNRNLKNPQMYNHYNKKDWFEIIEKECISMENDNGEDKDKDKQLIVEKDALNYVIVRILPFLRKICLMLNTFGLIEKGAIEKVLWTCIPDGATKDENINIVSIDSDSSINEESKINKNESNDTSVITSGSSSSNSDASNSNVNVNVNFIYDCDMNAVLEETTKLCEILQLPKIEDCVKLFNTTRNDNSRDFVLKTMYDWICNYLNTISMEQKKNGNGEILYLFNNSVLVPLTNTIKLPKLAVLPKDFNPLFQTAYEMNCDNKPKTVPEDSAICLLCGKFLCINCCRYDSSKPDVIVSHRGRNEKLKGTLTLHSKKCGFGTCVFLWLQRSDIVLIYEHAAAVFNSPYLDGHGEEDSGLRRGGLLYLNNVRLNKLTQMVTDQMVNNKVCQLRSRGKHYLRNWF